MTYSTTQRNPIISIITVVLNGEKHLEEAVKSVLNQKEPDTEYIIIDGGSTDRTIRIIKENEASIDYWISEPDLGVYDAINKGIARARGELIGLLHADDFYEPNILKDIITLYKRCNKPCIIYGDYYVLDESLDLKLIRRSTLKYWTGMSISHESMFVHRFVYEQLQKYNLQFKIAADYDFLMQAVKNNIDFEYIPGFVVNFRNQGASTQQLIRNYREASQINRKYLGLWNPRRAPFLVRKYLNLFLFGLKSTICFFFGEKALIKMIRWYKKIIYRKNLT